MEPSYYFYQILVFLFVTASISLGASTSAPPIGSRRVWYTSPAPEWNLALPIGSGRLGGMVYGGISQERVQVNEDSIWDGGFLDRVNPRATEGFQLARNLLLNESLTEAGQTVLATMSGDPTNPRAYHPMVELFCEFDHPEPDVKNYSRWLDTYGGYVGSEYTYKDVAYKRVSFGSFPASVLVLRFEANASAAINATVTLFRERNVTYHAADLGLPYSSITIRAGSGQADGINFTAQACLSIEGTSAGVSTNGTSVDVRNADALTIFVNAETSYRYADQQEWEIELNRKLDNVITAPYAEIERDALDDYTSLAHRTSLDLGSSGDIGLLPTIDRLRRWQDVTMAGDPELATLQFNLGRYMLITSSRKEQGILSLPANLQGVWSQRYDPPWGDTININTEMNYWPAEVTNLAETHLPLFDLIEVVRPRGRDVAKKMYNCPGFVTHHNTDLWGDSAPVDNGTQWTMWPMGAAWLSLHLIEHYRFNGNKTWLEHSALPVLQEVADFYYCYLFNHSGYYSTGPSLSPENSFRLDPDQTIANKTEGIDIAPTMDSEILWELFSAIVEAGAALGRSPSTDPSIAQAQHYLSHLQPPQISPSSLGTIMEWRRDYAEAEPGHRHISHLFGLFPGRTIDPAVSPSLAVAANNTLHRRLVHGGAGTGWSRAWTIAWFARLRDGDAAWGNVAQFLNTSVNDNLFSNNPYPTFQADGNFGFVAGVVEMVLQSHSDAGGGGGGGVVDLLPALPKNEIQDGEVKGLVARGGFVVDVRWEGGRLKEATVESRLGNQLALRVAGEEGFKVDGAEYTGPLDTVAGEKFAISL